MAFSCFCCYSFLHLRDIDSVMLCVVYVLDGIEMVEIVLILMGVCVCVKNEIEKN